MKKTRKKKRTNNLFFSVFVSFFFFFLFIFLVFFSSSSLILPLSSIVFRIDLGIKKTQVCQSRITFYHSIVSEPIVLNHSKGTILQRCSVKIVVAGNCVIISSGKFECPFTGAIFAKFSRPIRNCTVVKS